MKKRDLALKFSNPRLLAAIYYGLLSVVGTILINALLVFIGIDETIPLFKSVILGMFVASASGALFGKAIIYCPRPYLAKTFWLGFIMVIASLPIFALGLHFFMEEENNLLFSLVNVRAMIYHYIQVLAYSYILFGFFLAIAAGCASMYLRAYLVYDILHTDERDSQRMPEFIGKKNKTKAQTAKFTAKHKKTSTAK